ncbi:MAG: hypothetical protein QM718_12860 [Steroidobacteraceae bacterium]
MKRWLFLIHRYLGIALCLLMAAWCLSGIVMMYVAYPALEEAQRVAGSSPLSLARCCRVSQGADASDPDSSSAGVNGGDTRVADFRLEMWLDRPVLRWASEFGDEHSLDLSSGTELLPPSAAQALLVAGRFAANSGITGVGELQSRRIERDQWTVSGSFNDDRPLYRVALHDPAGTELYVSGASGAVVQMTTARQRFWNWFGSVTHWIYPTSLRAHPQAWTQVVVWTSLAGMFLTATGVWAGLLQWKVRSNGRRSPYRGMSLWHHLSGLIFGLLALTWVASGWLSMNPWGLLEGTGATREQEQLRGTAPTLAQVLDTINRLKDQPLPRDVRVIEGAPFAGHLYLMLKGGAVDRQDQSAERQGQSAEQRYDAATLQPSRLLLADLLAAATQLQPGVPLVSAELMTAEDRYYYTHHERAALPALRVVLDDAQQTRYYLDPYSGSLLRKVDRDARWYRWLFAGLHQWDFNPTLRQRPLWDIVVVTLLGGLAALFLTGVWLGVRRVTRSSARVRTEPAAVR